MNLAEIRRKKKMSQFDLAEKAGVSQACVSQVERGIKNPTLGTLRKISAALGVSIKTLIDDNKPSPAA